MRRDIARNRMVYHSSAFDKNVCGHLVTCGNPNDRWNKVPYQLKEQYEDATESIWHITDEQNMTRWCTPHKQVYFDVVYDFPVKAKGYRVFSNQFDGSMSPTEWRISGSNDGVSFTELDYRKFNEIPPFLYTYITDMCDEPICAIDGDTAYKFFRFEILDNNGSDFSSLGEFDLIGVDNKSLLRVFDGHFEQCWKSKGAEKEHLVLDLGAVSNIDQMIFSWGDEYALEYEILSSYDGESWESCYVTKAGKGNTEELSIGITARYLKLQMYRTFGAHYVLRQWKVMGENDLQTKQTDWRIERACEVSAGGTEISCAEFDDQDWFPAVVPGTVLNAYMEAGAVCEYNNDDNYTQHSDAFFTTNWWYRTHFQVAEEKKGKHLWLNFDAINWKADIYLNGVSIGDIKGAFIRKKIDITEYVRYGEENYLAVLIYCNNFPGPQKILSLDGAHFINGGVTGLDEPCLAASIGWDWITTVSGRNIGIYKDVYLSETDEIQLVDPWFETDAIDYKKNHARLTFRTEVKNLSTELRRARVKCVINDGMFRFSKDVILAPHSSEEIEMKDVVIPHANLWYPVGYGEPNLYKAEIIVDMNGISSDSKTITFGVREIEYLYDEDGVLSLSCNKKRLCCVGGNWGMDDATVRNHARDYDIKVRLHAEANFNMIRNWVGQTNDEAFYDACDKYGVMVWDDFWLANPGDGPDPLDTDMFMANAEDKLRKVRRHPSIVLYCGRNEGNPTEPLASLLPELVQRLNPKRLYIPHSAADPVSGFGPYQAMEKEFYFKNTRNTLHSERGIPNIPVQESIQKFLSKENQWPIRDTWVSHSFICAGAQHCDLFCDRVRELYGDYNSLDEFVTKSQMLCYETYKALFEAERAANGGGMILWMSSSAMPSFAFQTYDYYYATNGGYEGAKLANQPLYVYHNPVTREVVLDNRSGDTQRNLRVTYQLYDGQGKLLWTDERELQECMVGRQVIGKLDEYDGVVFLRTLVQSENGKNYRNFEWIYSEGKGKVVFESLDMATLSFEQKENALLVENVGNVPALQIYVSLVNTSTGEGILPVFWSDNFISLMPGEKQEITYTTYDDISDFEVHYEVSGFNCKKTVL